MELASEEVTVQFLKRLFFLWGQKILWIVCKEYRLTDDQYEALEELFLQPHTWQVELRTPLQPT